jgi:hypothetical protein
MSCDSTNVSVGLLRCRLINRKYASAWAGDVIWVNNLYFANEPVTPSRGTIARLLGASLKQKIYQPR